MWLNNAWYVAAFSTALQQQPLARTVLNQNVVLYRTTHDRPVALADRCPHRGVLLWMGRVIEDTLRCSYHGLRIDAEGHCVRIPCQAQIPAAARVRSYPVHDRYGFTWIWPGDADKAEPALIPDARWMDDPQWAACGGHIHAQANYQLFTDNLLDLLHESYLHEATIATKQSPRRPSRRPPARATCACLATSSTAIRRRST